MVNNHEIAKLIDVSKRYYLSDIVFIDALINVNLTVRDGEILIIMGPSGSGKTTLLNILGTLDRPTNGKVIINDVDVTNADEDYLARFRLERLGFVFQQYNLLPQLTALENVALPMLLTGKYTMEEAREKARLLLELVGLGDVVNNRPNQLSGGQQQRVAIARALANDPTYVLMDEPTGSIDLASTYLILDLVKLLNRALGVTFVIATHNTEVASIGTRIIYIRGGRVFEEEDLSRIRAEFSRSRINLKDIIDSYSKLLNLEERRLKRLGEDTSTVDKKRDILEKFMNKQGISSE